MICVLMGEAVHYTWFHPSFDQAQTVTTFITNGQARQSLYLNMYNGNGGVRHLVALRSQMRELRRLYFDALGHHIIRAVFAESHLTSFQREERPKSPLLEPPSPRPTF